MRPASRTTRHNGSFLRRQHRARASVAVGPAEEGKKRKQVRKLGAESGANNEKGDEAAMVVAVDVLAGGWRAEWVGRGLHVGIGEVNRRGRSGRG